MTYKTNGTQMTAKGGDEFLRDLFRGCEDGYITISTLPDRKNYHVPVRDVDQAAELITKLGQKQNTYYNMALRRLGLGEYTRGKDTDIVAVTCMYADIDVAGAAHKQDALPQNREEVLQFLDELEMPASYIIESGNGIHGIWLLKEPFFISAEDDLASIKSISLGFGAYLVRRGNDHGWHLDNVQDITRMLRAPGTLNFKTDPPKECRIVGYNPV